MSGNWKLYKKCLKCKKYKAPDEYELRRNRVADDPFHHVCWDCGKEDRKAKRKEKMEIMNRRDIGVYHKAVEINKVQDRGIDLRGVISGRQ